MFFMIDNVFDALIKRSKERYLISTGNTVVKRSMASAVFRSQEKLLLNEIRERSISVSRALQQTDRERDSCDPQ